MFCVAISVALLQEGTLTCKQDKKEMRVYGQDGKHLM
jgi:hypothetical protein